MSRAYDIVKNDPNRIVVFDTTLRDGEQSPGCSMNLEEKLKMAAILDELGVDVIEAGFPIASQGDWEAVNEIAKTVKNATVCGLSRAKKTDIEASGEAIKPAENRRIHTFISTSPLHMKFKLQMPPEEVLNAVTESVTTARNYTDDVEWSAEDASRTEDDFLCQCVEAAIKAGATVINIPDTVGYAIPDEYGRQIAMLFERVPNIDQAIISTHCHNDLGLAVANSLAGVKAGARQIECTINGIGERAGNAALEEIDTLKKRASSQKPSPILSRGKFVASLARRLGPGVTIHGCVARISIGNFDEVRERLGDEAAEELCVSVGSWLGGHVRQTDLVGRVGSGTFAIFFGFADKKNVREKMERLTKRIEHAPVTFKDETLFPKLSIEFEDVDADGEKVAEEASCAAAG